MSRIRYHLSVKVLPVILLLTIVTAARGQNLHNVSNAVSFENESNTTTGWTGTAVLTADSEDPFHGQYAFRCVTSPTNGREVRYTFAAVVGQTYHISIRARQGTPSISPAFANWLGFSGFTTRLITGTTWTEYIFTLVATSTAPVIRAYTSPSSGNTQGSTIYLDRVSIFSAADTQAPTNPGNLTASGTTINSTTLNWSASTDNTGVTAYDVFMNNAPAASVSGATTSYEVINLSPLTTYNFFVRARDAAGNISNPSDTISIQTPADTVPPTIPTGLSSVNTTISQTELSWNPSSDNVGVINYEIFIDSVSIGFTGNTQTNYIAADLQSGTTYEFTVAALDAAGNRSDLSDPVLVTTEAPDTEPPSTPENLMASSITTTSLVLTWDPSTDNVGVAGYEIFMDSVSVSLTGSPTPQFAVTGLLPATGYEFAVLALDAAGNISPLSNSLFVTTEAPDLTPPTPPTNLAASGITKTSLVLSWDASTDNSEVTDYEIFQNYHSIGSTGSPVNTYFVSGLTAATEYAFTIVASDLAGNVSETSDTLFIATPEAILFTDLNANLPTTDWTTGNLHVNGIAGIGVVPDSSFALSVNGAIRAKEIIVETGWSDFVFEAGYPLPGLDEVELHIRQYGHLKDIPSADEVALEGVNLGSISSKLLQKIEELTLYTIEIEKRLRNLETENVRLKKLFEATQQASEPEPQSY